VETLYERLSAAASLLSMDGAVRIVGRYEPIAGQGAVVAPPTVKSKGTDTAGYLYEPRWVGDEQVQVVYLDQYQSQANRCETALLAAINRGEIVLPHLELQMPVGDQILHMTSLEAPHRSRDAYFRDAQDSTGIRFDETATGRALRNAVAGDLRAYLELSPTDLVYGLWDSHRKRRVQLKLARAYASSLIGISPLEGTRAAGRYDKWNFPGDPVDVSAEGWRRQDPNSAGSKKNASTRPSEIGHGMIPPSQGLGGVSVRGIERTATVSMAQLAQLRFGDADERYVKAARALLAALILLADRLAFAAPALRLRSGCDLVLIEERVEWVQPGSRSESLPLEGREQALELFRAALSEAQDAGLKWAETPTVLAPQPALAQAIGRSFVFTGIGEAENV